MASDFLKQRQTASRYQTDFLIGDLLLKTGVISQKQLEEAIRLAGNKYSQVRQMLIMCGYLTTQNLQAAVDAQSVLRERAIDFNTAVKYLKIAVRTGRDFNEVLNEQEGAQAGPSNKLGELLLQAGLISNEQFAKAMQRSLSTGLPLGRILVLNGALPDLVLNLALDIQVRIRDGTINYQDAIEVLQAAGKDNNIPPDMLSSLVLPSPRKKGVRLGELLVLSGILTETDVMNALETGLVNGQPIGQILVNQGFITQELLEAALDLQKLVDQGRMDGAEAGDCLSKVQNTGISVAQALGEVGSHQSEAKPVISFEKLLTLTRIVTSDDIESAFDWSTKSAQIIAKVLHMTGYIEEDVMQAALRCHYLLSKEWLTQDDALIALDYFRRKEPSARRTLDDALRELGWTADRPIQLEGEEEGAVVVPLDPVSTCEDLPIYVASEQLCLPPSQQENQDHVSPTKIASNISKEQNAIEQDPQNLDSVEKIFRLLDDMAGPPAKTEEPPKQMDSATQADSLEEKSDNAVSTSSCIENLAPQTESVVVEQKLDNELLAGDDKTEVSEHVGGAFSRLAEGYYDQGNYTEAQQLYERILVIKQNELGVMHPSIVTDLNNLAGVLCVQGKFNQAELFLKKVILIQKSLHPPEPIKLADSLNTLAGMYFQQSKFDACEPLLMRSLSLRESCLGEDNPDIADTLRDYAKLLKQLGREKEAEQYTARAKTLLSKLNKTKQSIKV